jgi:hypothetical protein
VNALTANYKRRERLVFSPTSICYHSGSVGFVEHLAQRASARNDLNLSGKA